MSMSKGHAKLIFICIVWNQKIWSTISFFLSVLSDNSEKLRSLLSEPDKFMEKINGKIE